MTRPNQFLAARLKPLHRLLSGSGDAEWKRIVQNATWLVIEKVFKLGIGLGIAIWMARYLGPDLYGQFSFAEAFTALFAAIAVLGLQGVTVRELVVDPAKSGEILGTAAGLQLIGGFAAYIALTGVVWWLRPDDTQIRMLVLVLGSFHLFNFFKVSAYWFEAMVQSKYVVWTQNASLAAFACFKIALILSEAEVMAFAWAVLAESVVTGIALAFILHAKGVRLGRLRFRLQRAKRLMRDSWPLIFSAIAVTLAMRIDQIMIGQLLSSTSVGLYAVGVRLAEVLIFAGTIVSQSVFPRMIRLQGTRFQDEFVRYLRYPFYLLLFIATAVWAGSDSIVGLAYGAAYRESSGVLAVLIFSIPVTFVSVMSSRYLLRAGMHTEILLRQTCGMLVNISLNLLLIPKWGIVGAAAATVFTDLVIAFGLDLFRARFRELLNLKLRALLFLNVPGEPQKTRLR